MSTQSIGTGLPAFLQQQQIKMFIGGQWDVAARANKTAHGLAAGVWTNDLKRAHAMVRALKAGVVWVNTYNQLDAAAPFGGYKQSGYGREMGHEVLNAYTQTKTAWINLA